MAGPTAGAAAVVGLGAVPAQAATFSLGSAVTVTGIAGRSYTSVSWTDISNNALSSFSGCTTTGGDTIPTDPVALAISDANITDGAGFNNSDAFDGALALAIGKKVFTNPDGDMDLSDGGLVVTSDTDELLKDIDAQVQYRFFDDRAVVRAMFTVTNRRAAEVTLPLVVFGNLGSDGTTMIQATSSGDAAVDAGDLWSISNQMAFGENPADDNDPNVTTAVHGAGAPVPAIPLVRLGKGHKEDYAFQYNVTIPAGGTVRVLAFHELTMKLGNARHGARDFETLETLAAAGLLEGLTEADLLEVVNYAPLTPPEEPQPDFYTPGGLGITPGTGTVSGSIGFSLLGALGLLAARRRRQR
jgi:hypothetical protein